MTDMQTLAWLDQADARARETIRKFGVCLEYVTGDPGGRPESFAYTVGLTGLGHPELVVLSLCPRDAGSMLNELAARIRGGQRLRPGQLLEFADWQHRVVVEQLPNPAQVIFAANRHYGRSDEASLPAFQLTYDDLYGRFPWQAGYVNRASLQPRPGSWTA